VGEAGGRLSGIGAEAAAARSAIVLGSGSLAGVVGAERALGRRDSLERSLPNPDLSGLMGSLRLSGRLTRKVLRNRWPG
jgi:hypothetical protein